MSKNKIQGGFSQIITVFVLVAVLGLFVASVQKPTNSIPFAAEPTATKAPKDSGNRKDARTINLLAYQSPAPISADAKINCVYSNPLIDHGAPQAINNKFCPSGWTCVSNGQRFSEIKYGSCTPPANYVAATIPCNVSDNVISGKKSGTNASNPACPWRWACLDYNGSGACTPPVGVNLSANPVPNQTACTPDASNPQSSCPTGYECVPGPAGGSCYGPVPQ